MGARQKLNGIYVQSCLGIASVIGLIFGSWAVFFIAFLILTGVSLHFGNIRPNQSEPTGPYSGLPHSVRARPKAHNSQRRLPYHRRR